MGWMSWRSVPGPGGLTRALLALGAARVIAVEKDNRAIAALAEVGRALSGSAGRFSKPTRCRSIWRRICPGAPPRIVANLPYNIATPLLVGWLTAEPWPSWWQSLTLMFQREVAERIVAPPGTESYGRLGVLAGWRTEAKIMFDVAPSAFVPPPKVTSSVVHLVPRANPEPCSAKALLKRSPRRRSASGGRCCGRA